MKSLEKWGGFTVWVLVTIGVTVVEIFLLPLTTAGGAHLPISLLVVLVANLLLPRIFVKGLGLSWAWFIPPLIWIIVVLPSSTVTSDGDLLLPGKSYSSTLNMIYLGLGAIAAIVGAFVARTDFRAVRDLRRRRQCPQVANSRRNR